MIELFCALGVSLVGYTLALVVANWWADMFYHEDGEPTHCTECGSPFLHEQPVCEGEVRTICSDCEQDLAYWAYGAYDPAYREHMVDEAMTLGRWVGPLIAVGVLLCLI